MHATPTPSVVTSSSVSYKVSLVMPIGVGAKDPTPGPECAERAPRKIFEPDVSTVFSEKGVAV